MVKAFTTSSMQFVSFWFWCTSECVCGLCYADDKDNAFWIESSAKSPANDKKNDSYMRSHSYIPLSFLYRWPWIFHFSFPIELNSSAKRAFSILAYRFHWISFSLCFIVWIIYISYCLFIKYQDIFNVIHLMLNIGHCIRQPIRMRVKRNSVRQGNEEWQRYDFIHQTNSTSMTPKKCHCLSSVISANTLVLFSISPVFKPLSDARIVSWTFPLFPFDSTRNILCIWFLLSVTIKAFALDSHVRELICCTWEHTRNMYMKREQRQPPTTIAQLLKVN